MAAIPFERIVAEDLQTGYGPQTVTMPGGGTAIGSKVGLHTFTGHFNAQDFINAAHGDHTGGIQAAFDAGLEEGIPVWFPPSATPWVIEQTLTWSNALDLKPGPSILGSGRFATVFDNRVQNGPMIKINQPSALKFQHGGRLSGFQIMTTTHPVGSTGIYINAAYQLLTEDVRITGLSGTGVQIEMLLGDADGPVMLMFDRCWIEHCGGYGVNVTQAGGASENSFLSMHRCFIQYNTLGGARLRALNLTMLDCAFVRNSPASQGVGGLQVYATPSGSSRLIKLIGVTFEGNGVCHCDIQTGSVVEIINPEFLHAPQDIVTNPITYGLKLGNSSLANAAAGNVRVSGSFVRNYQAGYTQFSIGSASVLCRIENTKWFVFDATTGPGVSDDSGVSQTRFSDAGYLTRIEDNGFDRPIAPPSLTTTMIAGQSYTPDSTLYGVHRLVLSTVGAYTIATPTTTSVSTGKEILIDLVNSSGGVVTVTWGGGFTLSGFTNPGAGDHRIVRFYYDAGAQWQQVSAWNHRPYVVQRGAGTAKDDTFAVYDATGLIPIFYVDGQLIGIGTDTPIVPLEVRKSFANANLVCRVNNTSNTVGASAAYQLGTAAAGGHMDLRASGPLDASIPNVIRLTNFMAADIQFNIAGTTSFYIKSGGRIGINKALPGSALAVVGLPVYADNAAALLGGLTSGDCYRTATGVLMVTF